ncbi:SphA family protein [Bradyrhizobium sp. WSM471]|uniref:SphA family protein n=1 Tax=Bradyrhizobium sp. WSM471 TaxID=319017 RepID=UPI00024D2CC0|nr:MULTISPECIES: transporter [Bradyrhizobium]EHR04934.1 protein involved in meta-pathway of phenol degradation [Bradyrhizobium sp. WSM471]UFW40067.1 transporter [Bradyrhizobium canariense]
MGSNKPQHCVINYAAAIAALVLCSDVSYADQGGSSFWFPGQFASLAAVQQTPGWALSVIDYHSGVAAAGSAAVAKQIQASRIPANVNVSLNLGLSGRTDLVALAPSYTFEATVLGGQLVVGMSGQYGRAAASLAGTLTAMAGPIVVTRTGTVEGSLVSYGDLAPFAEVFWNDGVHNYMAYVTGNVPVGDYDPTRIPNIGLGHGAIDIGGAYTYFNPAAGNEISGVVGLTYNFKNPDTQYQSGINFHFDWGASHYLTKQLFVGLAGYAYQQIADDSGQNPILGGFRSRVFGLGPQIGYSFPIGDMQGSLSLRGYGEFGAANRPSGWNTWLTFTISPSAPAAVAPRKHLVVR